MYIYIHTDTQNKLFPGTTVSAFNTRPQSKVYSTKSKLVNAATKFHKISYYVIIDS